MIGRTVGHFEVLGRLGAGGMGVVYKARDLRLDRLVALKVLAPEAAADPERRQRFAREARAVAALSHPNIVTIYAVEEHDGVPMLAMEYIDGRALDHVIAGQGLPLARLFELAVPIARALTAAHERHIVHRDLKPGNVMVGIAGEVKVLDFGLARVERPARASVGSDEVSTAALTRQGMMLGTVPYMSPEQVKGEAAGHLSDIFSLGVVLYEMAVGRRPFSGETTAELASSILRDQPASVIELRPELPTHLGRIIRRCLEKEPARRYQTALDIANELEDLRREVESGEPTGIRASFSYLDGEATQKVHISPLVGRAAELADLQRLLESARAGLGALVMVGGEAGVGKTRLVDELICLARDSGFLTLVGHCYDTEGARPFSPWVEVLEYSTRVARRDVLRQHLGEGAPEVAKLLPELRRLFPDIPPPIALPPEQEQHYVFGSFRDYLERSSRTQPLLVALEDLQWADESTLLLLQHVAPQLGGMAILVVGTYRDVELDAGQPLERALRQLVRERLAQRMTLKRLSEPDVARLLGALARKEAPPPLVHALYQTTEGNPFFVEEVFQHLKEEETLFDRDGGWRDLDVEDLDVPEGVRLVVGRRLEKLDDEARKVLTAAAVIGRRFHFYVLEALGELDPDTLVATVEAAERLRLIQPVSGRESRFEFTQELVRQTLASGLSSLRRQRLHLRIAAAMEHIFAGDLDNHASALAHHLYQAGAAAERGKTVYYLALAGRRALAMGAPAEAVRRLEEALSLLDKDDLATRADLVARKGRTLRSLGRHREAEADWLEALPLYERLGDSGGVVRTCLGAAAEMVGSARNHAAAEVAQRGVRFLQGEPSVGRCRLLAVSAAALARTGDLVPAEPMMKKAFADAEAQRASPRIQGEMLLSKAWLHYVSMQYQDCIGAGSRGADLLSGVDEWVAISNLGVTLIALNRLGRGAEAEALADRLGPRATRFGHSHALFYVSLHRFERTLTHRGDFERCLEIAEVGFQHARTMAWRTANEPGNGHRTISGLCHFFAGRLKDSTEQIAEATAVKARDETGAYVDGEDEGYLFVAQVWEGNHDAARATLDRLSAQLPQRGAPVLAGRCWRLFGVVEGLALLGERERAGTLHDLVVQCIGTGVVTRIFGYGLARTVAAISASCAERWDEAEDHFALALRQAHELPHVIEQGEARRWWAWTLLHRGGVGDRDRARELLGEAIEIYERLHMPMHLERARGMIDA